MFVFAASRFRRTCVVLALSFLGSGDLLARQAASEDPGEPFATVPDIAIRHLVDMPANPVRIAKDPRDSSLYVMQQNGRIFRLDGIGSSGPVALVEEYSPADHGESSTLGFAFGPDGTIYLVGNEVAAGQTVSTVVRGVPDEAGEREWSALARTDAYPRSNTAFDHVFNAVIVSDDGREVFVNSGSRTDHGEVQSGGGTYPGMREVPLTARVFRLPTEGGFIELRNDEAYLRERGYVFADGVRNAFSFAYSPDGDLFATENGPDRDNPDSLLWLREGHHYGFPWVMGGEPNPQQFSDYDPDDDPLLDPDFIAVQSGYYHNDPDFPQPPDGIEFTEPVLNFGPDGVMYRDAETGEIRDAGAEGTGLYSFTGHRSPLGLVFDHDGVLAAPYRHAGFVLSWTKGDPEGDSIAGPFNDPGEDLLHLSLRKRGDNYEMNSRRIVGGFSNPIDTEIIGNRLYVIEFGGNHGVWEIRLPARNHLRLIATDEDRLWFGATGSNEVPLRVERTFDFQDWENLRVLENPHGYIEFEEETSGEGRSFYRVRPGP